MRSGYRLAVALSLAVLGCKPTIGDIYDALPAVGDPVPEFSFATLEGSVVTPGGLGGQPAVVALWSSTCAASRLALAALDTLHRDFGSRGARVLILADDDDPASVAMALERVAAQVPVAMARGALMDTFAPEQSVLPWREAFALPTFLVLDAAGRVVYRQVGIEQEAGTRLRSVRAQLDSLVRQAPRAGSVPAAT